MAKLSRPAFPALSAEEHLRDYAHRLRRHCKGRQALRVRLSALSRQSRQDRILRPVQIPLRTLLQEHKGELFCLQSKDLICIAMAPKAAFESVMLKITYLLRDDPLLKAAIDRGDERDFLYTLFDLTHEYEDLLSLIDGLAHDQIMNDVPPKPTAKPVKPASTPNPAPKPAPLKGYRKIVQKKAETTQKPIDPDAFLSLEKAIGTLDATNFIYRDPIMLLQDGRPERVLMQSLAVDTNAVVRSVMPDHILEDRSRFSKPVRVRLADRLLASDPIISVSGLTAVLIELNLHSICDPLFAQFISRQTYRGVNNRLIAAIDYQDASQWPLLYQQARDILSHHQMGCALVRHDPLQFVMRDRALLSSDMDQLDWSRLRRWKDSGDWRFDHVKQAIRMADPARFILSGCDGPEALELGRTLGVRLYSGPYIKDRARLSDVSQ